ncbi:MAG TPA: hypothetical protein VLH13_05320, partial [Methanomassiliicoccales archaeon]|nr:hypothetical protein [Methanomassiliicoccales archaeon]
KDGTVYLFCTMKCEKNMIDLKRVPRRVEWTKAYATAKMIHKSEKHEDETAAPAKKKKA